MILRILIGVALLYLAAAAYSDIRMDRLLKAPPPDQPVEVKVGIIPFADVADAELFKYLRMRTTFFPWAEVLSETIDFILLSIFAGFFGGLVRDVRDHLHTKTSSTFRHCLFGMVLGPPLFIVAALYPPLMLENEPSMRPQGIIAVAFLGGMFSSNAWNFLQQYAKQKFNPGAQ